nr:uncharacterized protein LOC129137995 [Pan troglodytes]
MDFVAPSTWRKGGGRRPANPIDRGHRPLGGEGGQRGHSPLSSSLGDSHGPANLKHWLGPYCANCQLQPRSTALCPSQGETAFPGRWKEEARRDGFVKQGRAEAPKMPASGANEGRSSFSKGEASASAAQVDKPWERRLQLQPQPETLSTGRKLGSHWPRGAALAALPPPRPQLRSPAGSPRGRAPAARTHGQVPQDPLSWGSGTCRPRSQRPLLTPPTSAGSTLQQVSRGAARTFKVQLPLPALRRPPLPSPLE